MDVPNIENSQGIAAVNEVLAGYLAGRGREGEHKAKIVFAFYSPCARIPPQKSLNRGCGFLLHSGRLRPPD